MKKYEALAWFGIPGLHWLHTILGQGRVFSFKLGERAPSMRVVQPVITVEEGIQGLPRLGF